MLRASSARTIAAIGYDNRTEGEEDRRVDDVFRLAGAAGRRVVEKNFRDLRIDCPRSAADLFAIVVISDQS